VGGWVGRRVVMWVGGWAGGQVEGGWAGGCVSAHRICSSSQSRMSEEVAALHRKRMLKL